MNPASAALPQLDIFKFVGADEASFAERLELAWRRAKAIGLAYSLESTDILRCSEKFWNMHLDMTCAIDGAALAFWTIQYNLVVGTIAAFAQEQPELNQFLEDAMHFRVTLRYMLTELGHGLDAPNIETTATLLPSGRFELHTPNDNAAKHMPGSIPVAGVPCVAVLFARLLVDGKDRGIRPFLVALNDGHSMCQGVTSRLLPNRFASKPIGHCITHFDHVVLPSTALLGKIDTGRSRRVEFLSNIWRIGLGSILLTSVIIPGFKMGAYIVGKYSQRRTVMDPSGQVVPLVHFRTQQAPIFHALSQGWVLEAFFKSLRKYFADSNTPEIIEANINLRNAVSTVFKVIAVRLWRETNTILTDRCGAQGLFEHNQLVPSEMEIRGVAVAEGDILVLSIRLTGELLLGRYEVPPAKRPDSPLGLHEQGLFDELRGLLFTLDGKHRTEQFNRRILPRCMELTEAIGLRMAHEAAQDAGIDPALVELFEIMAIQRDIGWYIEHKLISGHQELLKKEEGILTVLEPRLDQLLDETGAKPYTFAAISSQAAWDRFYGQLPVSRGNAVVDVVRPTAKARL